MAKYGQSPKRLSGRKKKNNRNTVSHFSTGTRPKRNKCNFLAVTRILINLVNQSNRSVPKNRLANDVATKKMQAVCANSVSSERKTVLLRDESSMHLPKSSRSKEDSHGITKMNLNFSSICLYSFFFLSFLIRRNRI